MPYITPVTFIEILPNEKDFLMLYKKFLSMLFKKTKGWVIVWVTYPDTTKTMTMKYKWARRQNAGRPCVSHIYKFIFLSWEAGEGRAPTLFQDLLPLAVRWAPDEVSGLLHPYRPWEGGREGSSAFSSLPSTIITVQCSGMTAIRKSKRIRSKQAWIGGGGLAGLCAGVTPRPGCRPHPQPLVFRSLWEPGPDRPAGLPRAQLWKGYALSE